MTQDPRPSEDDQGTPIDLSPPELLSSAELFDVIMSEIDPRFTLSGQEEVKAKLLTASDEEKLEMIGAFQSAMKAFDTKADEYFALLKQVVTLYRKSVEEIGRDLESTKAENNLNSTITD